MFDPLKNRSQSLSGPAARRPNASRSRRPTTPISRLSA